MAAPPVPLDVRPLTGVIGAEIHGVDLAAMDDATWAAVRSAWLEHLVVFFPHTRLDPDGHVALGRRLGELEIHPFIPKLDDEHPEIVVLDSDGGYKADVWHTDVTFSPTPPMASILRVHVCPPTGGDTLWTNQYLAYDELSDPLKDLLQGLTALHHGAPFGHPEIQATHPVVRTHPETRRKVLYVNRTFTSHIVEMRRQESDALLQYLYTWSEQPRFQVRYRWTPGALGLWDNRCTMHHAVDDYDAPRIVQRVTVLGDVPSGGTPRWGPFTSTRRSANDGHRDAATEPVTTDRRTNSIAVAGLTAGPGPGVAS